MNVMKILMVVSLLVQTRKEVLTAHVPTAKCSESTKRHVKMKVKLSWLLKISYQQFKHCTDLTYTF